MASPQGILSALPSTLPEGTAHVKFTSMKNIQRLVDLQITKYSSNHLSSPFIAITNIPPDILQKFDRVYVGKAPRITVDLKSRILILETMVLESHEIFSHHFEFTMNKKLESTGLESAIFFSGASRVHYGHFVKEPDASWAPIGSKNPTVVLESGLSEKSNQLAIEAQAWLEANGSKTKAVVTACIDRRQPMIVLNLWEKCVTGRPGPITRSHKNAIVASKILDITIHHKDARTTITSDLTLPFEVLMDRPSSAKWETDVSFTREELEKVAEMTWKSQNFM